MKVDFKKLHTDVLIKCFDTFRSQKDVEIELQLSKGAIYSLGKGCNIRSESFMKFVWFVGNKAEDYIIKE